jgi:ribosome-associated protein
MAELDGRAREAIESAVHYTFARAGGPGGQNVNKVASKAVAKLALSDLGFLSDDERGLLRARLGRRINGEGEIVVAAQDTRDQGRNRQIALARMTDLLERALQQPKKRRKTRPGKGAREARLRSKRIRAAHKKLRGPADED